MREFYLSIEEVLIGGLLGDVSRSRGVLGTVARCISTDNDSLLPWGK